MKYPIIIEPNIYQYDETGGVGGASNYIKSTNENMFGEFK